MKKTLSCLIILSCALLTYQNCSPGSDRKTSGSASLLSTYPYDNKPDYFDNIQVIKAELQTNHTWKFSFSAVIAYADSPGTLIDTEIYIVDENNYNICPVTQAQVNNNSNNIPILDCVVTNKPENIHIVINAKLASESLFRRVSTYNYTFN